jgi:hypothetical protein
MLDPDQAPHDALQRVIVNMREEPTGSNAEPAFWFPQLIAEAVSQLLEVGDRLWCLGELHQAVGARLRTTFPALAVLESASIHWLIAAPLTVEQLTPEVWWPPYCSDYGFRFFAFRDHDTALEATLEAIYQGVDHDPESANAQWQQLYRASIRRDGLASYCREAKFCVQPDGEHFLEAAFHSREVSCEAVRAAFRTVCETHGVPCEATWNRSDEYLDFFDLRAPHSLR